MATKNNSGAGVLVMFIIAAFIYALWLLIHKANYDIDSKKSKIGQSIVVSKDTLIIVDWNPSSSTYTLSNGVKVSDEFIGKINQ